MPTAPRFTQRPSIQQTDSGDLLMECVLEADPPPDVRWSHSGSTISSSLRVILTLTNLNDNLYKAGLVIKEPNASDGGAYKCTAVNQLGESNANINLNFAGGDERVATPSQRGPTFVGKPRIIPKDGGALILMECKVKSPSRPSAKWSKDGTLLEGSNFKESFSEIGDNMYLCQLEIRKPSSSDAGQYRCTIKNDQGETNANLSLNFQQEETSAERSKSPSTRRKSSRSNTPQSMSETIQFKKRREETPTNSHLGDVLSSTKNLEISKNETLKQTISNEAEPQSGTTALKRKSENKTLTATKKERRRSNRSKSRSPSTSENQDSYRQSQELIPAQSTSQETFENNIKEGANADSGLKISEERIKELIKLSERQIDSDTEDELTESISELPSLQNSLRQQQIGKKKQILEVRFSLLLKTLQ